MLTRSVSSTRQSSLGGGALARAGLRARWGYQSLIRPGLWDGRWLQEAGEMRGGKEEPPFCRRPSASPCGGSEPPASLEGICGPRDAGQADRREGSPPPPSSPPADGAAPKHKPQTFVHSVGCHPPTLIPAQRPRPPGAVLTFPSPAAPLPFALWPLGQPWRTHRSRFIHRQFDPDREHGWVRKG